MGRDFPVATLFLVAANLLVAWRVTGFLPTEASVLAVSWSRADLAAGEWWRLVASMFAHAGPLHLIVNMLGLVSLGPYLERALGTGRFVALYFAAGVAGGLAHVFTTDVPGVGASGAIFGLMGVLLMLAPTAMLAILFLLPLQAVLAIALYVALVLFVPAFSVGPVAHMAHLGGLAMGVAYAFIVAPRAATRHAGGVLLVFSGVSLVMMWATFTDLPTVWRALQIGAWGDVFAAAWPALAGFVVTLVALGHLHAIEEEPAI